jgi:hypothetical protein
MPARPMIRVTFTANVAIFAGCAAVGPRGAGGGGDYFSGVGGDASRPFARVYGARKARWLNDNQAAIFSHTNPKGDFLDVEIEGFKKLDVPNQKLYLVTRFCTRDPGNAEDGSQMWRLMGALKCSAADLRAYMDSQDQKAIALYASYLRGSLKQFQINVRHYCR